MPVLLKLASSRTVKATIHNLSANGFRLTSDAALRSGMLLAIRAPRQSILCELRWTDGNQAGGVFLQKAEPAEW